MVAEWCGCECRYPFACPCTRTWWCGCGQAVCEPCAAALSKGWRHGDNR